MFTRIKIWLLEKLRKLLHGLVDRSIDKAEDKLKPQTEDQQNKKDNDMKTTTDNTKRFKSPIDTKGGKIVAFLLACTLLASSAMAQTFKSDPVIKYDDHAVVAGDGTNVMDVINNSDPSVSHGLQEIIDALTSSSITNVYYTTYGLYAPGLNKKYGGGIGAFHPLSEYLVAGVRLDYVNGGFWMPSGSATFQIPLKWKFIKFTPLTYAGIGVPLSGAKIGDWTIPGQGSDNNGQATAILGYGGAIQLYKSDKVLIGLVGDVETWSGFPDKQYRFGLVTKIAF